MAKNSAALKEKLKMLAARMANPSVGSASAVPVVKSEDSSGAPAVVNSPDEAETQAEVVVSVDPPTEPAVEPAVEPAAVVASSVEEVVVSPEPDVKATEEVLSPAVELKSAPDSGQVSGDADATSASSEEPKQEPVKSKKKSKKSKS